MGRFHKHCRLESCKKPFESDSRNSKYCSQECLDGSRKIHHSRGRRRRNYRKDVEGNRAASLSRKQAREFAIAEHAMSACTRCGEALLVKDLEDHHRDGDPFNNDKDNLTLLGKNCHAKSDTEWRKAKEEGVSIVDVRRYQQVGVVVLDRNNVPYLALPGQELLALNVDQAMKLGLLSITLVDPNAS